MTLALAIATIWAAIIALSRATATRRPRTWRDFITWPRPVRVPGVRLNRSRPETLCDVMNQPAAVERIHASKIVGL